MGNLFEIIESIIWVSSHTWKWKHLDGGPPEDLFSSNPFSVFHVQWHTWADENNAAGNSRASPRRLQPGAAQRPPQPRGVRSVSGLWSAFPIRWGSLTSPYPLQSPSFQIKFLSSGSLPARGSSLVCGATALLARRRGEEKPLLCITNSKGHYSVVPHGRMCEDYCGKLVFILKP